MSEALLEVRDATLAHGPIAAVTGASLTVVPGEVVALCGPNGAGKSTLLAGMAGDLAPRSGAILLSGEPASALPPAELARRRAVLEQAPSLSAPFTVAELAGLAVPLDVSPAEARGRVAAALLETGLADRAAMPVDRLSGGQLRRAHLARVLAQLPPCGLLLLDEPTANLDLRHQIAVMETARRAADAGAAVVAVLHDLALAAAYADRVALMEAGRIVAEGRPATVFSEARLSAVYGTPIEVMHASDGQLRIAPRFPPRRGHVAA